MTAYKHAFALWPDSSPQRVDAARALLDEGCHVVLLNERVAVRPEGDTLLCEVIDPLSDGQRTASRLEGLLASGQELVKTSPLYGYLQTKTLRWIVVQDYGMGTLQLWPLPGGVSNVSHSA